MYIKKYWGSFIGGSDDSLNFQNLDEYNTPARRIRITATPEEYDAMNKILADFARNPLEYDLSEMMGEDDNYRYGPGCGGTAERAVRGHRP